MQRKHIAVIMLIVVVVTALLTIFVLTQQDMHTSTPATPSIATTPIITISITQTTPLTGVIIQGAGATFVYPQLNEWAQLFHSKTGIKVSYQSVGSGAGLSMFFQGTVDFACSDPPLSKDIWEKYQGRVLQIPWLAGAVVVVYNIPELSKSDVLKLDETAIARIYKGEITHWDDPYIKQLNPDIADKLPHEEIIAVYRSDSSGTTEIFTTYLYKATNGTWPRELVGKTVNWPVASLGRGIGGKGNEGVTQIVMQTQYTIGYVEWGYAIVNNLSIATLKNAANVFVKPSEESIMSALGNINMPKSPLDDFSHMVFEAVYAPGEKSYPIAALTHIVLWKRYEDSTKAMAIKEFLKWIVESGYQHIIPGYAAPPEPVKNLLKDTVNIIET